MNDYKRVKTFEGKQGQRTIKRQLDAFLNEELFERLKTKKYVAQKTAVVLIVYISL